MSNEKIDKYEQIGRLVRDVGFPIVVAVYLLVRFDTLFRQHTDALTALTFAVTTLIGKHP
jgi:hypothetical protein